MPNLQWRTPDDGQRNWPKHVEFLDKNKFGKISASVGFIINEMELLVIPVHYFQSPFTSYLLGPKNLLKVLLLNCIYLSSLTDHLDLQRHQYSPFHNIV